MARRPNGSGGLFKIRNGALWRGVAYGGFDENGNRLRWEVTAKTKTACRDKLEALQAEIRESGGYRAPTVNVETWASRWLENVKSEIDPKTWTGYRAHVRLRIVPAIGRRRLAQLLPSDIRAVHLKARADGLSESKVRESHIVLSRILDDAVRERLLNRNPAKDVKTPRASAKSDNRGAFSVDQATAILKTAIDMPNHAGARWLFKLLAGPRQGELLGAEIAQFDPQASTYQIAWKLEQLTKRHGCARGSLSPVCGARLPAGCPNASFDVPPGFEYRPLVGRFALTRPKSSTRIVPIITPLRDAILGHIEATKHLPNPHALIWRNLDGSPIRPNQDNDDWRRLLFAAGIIEESQLKPGGTVMTGHWARHTTVTVLALMGVDLQLIGEIVGHSTEKVTTIYRHAQASERMRAMATVQTAFSEVFGLPAE